MLITKKMNDELNGIELYFSERPSAEILSELKTAKWRYHRRKNCWYAKQSSNSIALADKLANDAEGASQTTNNSTEAEKADGIYMPLYDTVDGAKIVKSAESVKLMDLANAYRKTMYIADIQAEMSFCLNDLYITDLRNAMTTGKTCKVIHFANRSGDPCKILNYTMQKYKNLRELYDGIILNGDRPDDSEEIEVYEREKESYHTFTPFKAVKPIKVPKKWTIPHVWKAMLSGQIFSGQIDEHLTDDYALDAERNFMAGRVVHLPTFAKELIESSSGWGVTEESNENGIIQIGLNCCTFDYRTFLFDANCDCVERERRQKEAAEKLDKANSELLDQVMNQKQIKELTETGDLFDVRYLYLDQNTGAYEVRERKATRANLLRDDWEDTETFQQIISIDEAEVQLDALYEIDGNENLNDDERVIYCGVATANKVTGKALVEIIRSEKGAFLSGISLCRVTIAELKDKIIKQIKGQIVTMFQKEDVPRLRDSLDKLVSEEFRLSDFYNAPAVEKEVKIAPIQNPVAIGETNGMKIYASSDMPLQCEIEGYFEDIQAKITLNEEGAVHSFCCIDLSNAMKDGQFCREVRVVRAAGPALSSGSNTVRDMYDLYFASNGTAEDTHYMKTEVSIESEKCFSPFVKHPPIEKPERWTRKLLWQALSSGQIEKVEVDLFDDSIPADAPLPLANIRELTENVMTRKGMIRWAESETEGDYEKQTFYFGPFEKYIAYFNCSKNDSRFESDCIVI